VSTTLKVSLLLNLCLAGCLVCLLHRRPEADAENGTPVSAESGQRHRQEIAEPAIPNASVATESRRFLWSQLESTDYRTYIANLRGIGCPEQTVRDIITADLEGVYAPRREALQRRLAAVDASSANRAERHGVEAAVNALRDEESATLTALLGPDPCAKQIAANPSTNLVATETSELPNTTVGQRQARADVAVTLPLVFQDGDAAALNLNDRQIQAIAELKQRFVDEVGGPGQDPNDPAYRQRWLGAQPEVDNMMRGMIGVSAFQNYQIAAQARRQQGGLGN